MSGVDEGGEVAPPRIGERLRQVEEAAELVATGRWSLREFEAALRGWLQAVEEQEARIGAAEVPQELRNELALGLDGARLYRVGLSRMLCYADDRNPQHLAEGLEDVRRGNERLNQALHLNPRALEILRNLRP